MKKSLGPPPPTPFSHTLPASFLPAPPLGRSASALARSQVRAGAGHAPLFTRWRGDLCAHTAVSSLRLSFLPFLLSPFISSPFLSSFYPLSFPLSFSTFPPLFSPLSSPSPSPSIASSPPIFMTRVVTCLNLLLYESGRFICHYTDRRRVITR